MKYVSLVPHLVNMLVIYNGLLWVVMSDNQSQPHMISLSLGKYCVGRMITIVVKFIFTFLIP